MAATKKGLGKGLDALFFDNATEVSSVGAELLKITDIEPNRNQPRKNFEEEPLLELAESIREHGLIQPLLVRPLQKGGYQIIAGERRWRASRMAGLLEVPVIIRDIDDEKTMELALIENLQRENLNAVEEALGYKELMDSYKLTQAEVSKSVGKSRSAVANTLRLLNLPEDLLRYVQDGLLSSGHARALLGIEDVEKQRELAEKTIKLGLNVRDIERLSKENNEKEQKQSVKSSMHDSYYSEVQISLRSELNRKVKVNAKDDGKGTIELPFYDKEDLKRIVEALEKGLV